MKSLLKLRRERYYDGKRWRNGLAERQFEMRPISGMKDVDVMRGGQGLEEKGEEGR